MRNSILVRKQVIYTLTIILLLLCLAFLLRLVTNPITFHFYEQQPNEPTGETSGDNGSAPGLVGDVPNWLQFLAAALMTLFSFWLYRLGRLQSLLLKRANATAAHALAEARNANEETKRSVNAYIAAEAGRMLFEQAQFVDEANRIQYTFKNLGRAVCIVDSIGYRFRRSDTITLELNEPGKFVALERDIRNEPVKGDGLCTGTISIPEYCYIDEEDPRKGLRDGWIVQFSVLYRTLGGKVHYGCNWGWDMWGSMKLKGEGYEHEENVRDDWPTDKVLAPEWAIESTLKPTQDYGNPEEEEEQ